MSDNKLIVNPAAGLERVAEALISRLHARGWEIWNRGLGDVVKRAIKENGVIDHDFTVEELAERAGILKPERRRKA